MIQGISLAEQYLGEGHSITVTIRNSYLAAKRTLATKARARPCSATRGQKSPGKTGSRLLLSPRSGSLRSPSPLAKDQSGSQIPTPRSIIADALSRAPVSALPPLEVQSPFSAGKRKKKKADTSENKSEAPALSPTDPFFSPRFRFEDGSSETKAKQRASISSPRSSTVAGKVEDRTPPSSKGKRERRKSSVKKTPTMAEGGESIPKDSGDERTKTASTPHSSEEGLNSNVAEPQDNKHTPNDRTSIRDALESSTSDMILSDEPLEVTKHIAAAAFTTVADDISSNDHADDTDNAKCHGDLTPPEVVLVQTQVHRKDAEVGAVEGAVTIVLTKVIDKLVQNEMDLHSSENIADPKEDDVLVTLNTEGEDPADDLPAHGVITVYGVDCVEPSENLEVTESVVADHSDDMEVMDDYEMPPPLAHTDDVDLPNDTILVISESVANVEAVNVEDFHQIEASDAVGTSASEFGHEPTNSTEDVEALADEDMSSSDDTLANVEATNLYKAEEPLYFMNTEANEMDDISPEGELLAAIAADEEVAGDATTAATYEHLETDSTTVDNDAYNYEKLDRSSEVDYQPDSYEQHELAELNLPENEQISATGDAEEQVSDQEQVHASNGMEDAATASAAVETPVDEVPEENAYDHEHYALTENPFAEVEVHNAFEAHEDEEGFEAHGTPEYALLDHVERVNTQDNEDVEAYSPDEPQHDWSQVEPAAVEDLGGVAEFYQEPHEEHVNYDDDAEGSEHHDDLVQGDDESTIMTSVPDPEQGTEEIGAVAEVPVSTE
ncbi:unnamed protein product [Phytophthora fragariaefolia]|uniref:Unnamed protein product n=1 Tax=Phytophthora fragariaefolia TaxID=1490495 RepID=A0A9W7CSC8_9STRA|nr:unnamed protein product [Phytophthora fragariaefolia]